MKTTKHLHLGRIGELLAKSEFIKNGFDVFSTEVDDKGVDLVLKNKNGEYFDIQVKATNGNYVFMRKEVFSPQSKNLYLALLIFESNSNPIFILIPSTEWANKARPDFLTDKDYVGKKSKPEFGINISARSIIEMQSKYSFSKTISRLSPSVSVMEGQCLCDTPTCAKCLGVNCKDEDCKIHTQEKKRMWQNKHIADNSVVYKPERT